jgi:error-prone DNA polymerase
MGFYSPATIIDDGKRRGVEIRPVDVTRSDWDCTLEPSAKGFALRMGLRYVKRLGTNDGQRIEAARRAERFEDIEDFARRTKLNEGALEALSESGAFEGLGSDRRQSLWESRGATVVNEPLLPLESKEIQPVFPELDELETITWDYRASSHSTRGHPLAPLRKSLQTQGLPTAKEVSVMRQNRPVRYAGLVICRQRPGTASGVTFMTLEDETGFVNLVIWPKVFEAFTLLIKTTSFLGVTGKIQTESDVVHVIVEKLWKPRVSIDPERVRSRDFH